MTQQEFLFHGWAAGEEAVLELSLDGRRRAIRGCAFPYTAATPPGGLAGTLRPVGAWPVIPGRISCARCHLEDAGGRLLAAVMVCPLGDARPLPNPQPLAATPTLVIGAADGVQLAGALDGAAGLRATVSVASEPLGVLRSANVVADLGAGPRRLLVVAHLDSVADSPGANDNAAGVATALRLLEHFAARPAPDVGLRVLFSGAEEPFIVGARAYANGLVASGAADAVIGCLSLDMVAVGDRFAVRVPDAGLWQGPVQLAAQASPTGVPVRVEPSIPASDHWAFHEVGIPSAQLTRIVDDEYHTRRDAAARVGDRELDEAATMAMFLVEHALRAAGADTKATNGGGIHAR